MSQIISREIDEKTVRATELVWLIDANLTIGYHYRDDDGQILVTLDQVVIAIEQGRFLNGGDYGLVTLETDKTESA